MEKNLIFEDKNIKELLLKGKINHHVYSVLENENIYTLSEIIKYFQENLTFFRIKYIGKSSNELLVKLVNEYFKLYPEIVTNNLFDILKNEEDGAENKVFKEKTSSCLLKEGKIDVRTYNVLNNAKINNLLDLIEHYIKYKRFDNFKNAGRRTDEYLMKIIKDNRNNRLFGQEFYTETILEKIETNKLGINPKLKVESLDEYEQLSCRTKNILKFEDLDTLKKLIEHYSEKRNFLDVRNCGRKSNNELLNLSECILEKINDKNNILFNLSDDFLDFIHEIKIAFGVNAIAIETLQKQYLERNIEIFSLIKLLAKNYFNKRNYAIYFLLNKYTEGPRQPTLEKIGYLLRITRERVRQIRNNDIQKFNETLTQFFNEDHRFRLLYKKYFETNADIVVIYDAFAKNINKTEKCDFNKKFIGFILGQVYNDTYFNFCINDNSAKKNEYLIRKDLESSIDWRELIKKISKLIKAQRTIRIDVESVVRQHLNEYKEEKINRVVKIIKTIVTEEYIVSFDQKL